MRLLVLALLSASAIASSVTSAEPVAVARAQVSEKPSGWSGDALILEKGDDSEYLRVALVKVDGTTVINENLISRQEAAGLNSAGRVYNASVEVQKSNGSLLISNWRDMGSSNWWTTYSVSFRNGKFLVSGLDYNFQYRDLGGSCQVNFLTGNAIVNGKQVSVKKREVEFSKTNDADLQMVCEELLPRP